MNLFRIFLSKLFTSLFVNHKSLIYSSAGLAPLVIIVVVALIAAAVPTTIILVQQEQDNRQLAQSSTKCSQYNNQYQACRDAGCSWQGEAGSRNVRGLCVTVPPTPTPKPSCESIYGPGAKCDSSCNSNTHDSKGGFSTGICEFGLQCCVPKSLQNPNPPDNDREILNPDLDDEGVPIKRSTTPTPITDGSKPRCNEYELTNQSGQYYGECKSNCDSSINESPLLSHTCDYIEISSVCCKVKILSDAKKPAPISTPTTTPPGGGDTVPTRIPPTLTPTPSPVASPFCQGRRGINTSAPNTKDGYVGVRCGNYAYGTDGQRAGLGCGGQYFDLFACNDNTTQAYACSTPECISACNTTAWCPIPSPTPELSPSPIADGGGSGRTTRKLPGDSCSADSECFSLTCMPAVNSTNKYCVSSLGVRFCEEKGQEVTGPNIYANCPKN